MKKNLLDNIKIASPCSADWDEMQGDNRKRFCSHCKLNVYNLSEMTQTEAENLLFEMEGKMCVRLYKRKDGTVITQDCPVGLARLKRKVSQTATAVFSLIVGLFGGIFAVSQMKFDNSELLESVSVEKETETENSPSIEVGDLSYEKPILPKSAIMGKPTLKTTENNKLKPVVCRVGAIRDLQDEPVELWIK